jgi:general secretion pathway protein F
MATPRTASNAAQRVDCMPLHSFKALDAQGNPRSGIIDADSVKAARHQLRAQSLIPLEVTASAKATLGGPRRLMSTTALAVWTRQLAGLVGAGLPLERALSSLADEADSPALAGLMGTLRSEVNAGATFGAALAQHPREFSDIYRAVIAAGEQSGNLGLMLERLADDLEEQQALKSKLLGAALYPGIVSVVAFFIVMFLMTYVVPQVAGVFTGTQRALPWLTVAMLGASDIVRTHGWWLMLLMLAAGAAFAAMYRQEAPRLNIDAAFLRLPVIGRLARGYNAARFASTLAMLSAAGVPILKALQAAAQTLNNRAMRSDALQALVMVREGAPLASALAQHPRFPGLLAMFARLGEQTGQLPDMLQRAARQLGNDVQRRALQLATLLEPLLIVAMGLVVMLIVLAVLLPIIQMNTWVR